MYVHHPRENNIARTHTEKRRRRKKKENSSMYNEKNRPGRNAHTKNKYTPVQRARK
jgi:hypothetical protein